MQKADATQLRAETMAGAAQLEAALRWIARARGAYSAQRASLAVLEQRVHDRDAELITIHDYSHW